MNQNKSEKYLSICYPLLVVFGLMCLITSAVAWNHWKYVLDTCVERNCGCILNGVTTISFFTGGHIAYCHYVTFALLLSIAAALVFGSYHVWRSCMSNDVRRVSRHSVRQRSGEMIIMTAQSEIDDNEISSTYWTVAAMVSGFMILYTLIHAIIYIDGAWESCKQYRNELVKHMSGTGTLVSALQGRISCNAVFDFMDYLFADVSYDRRRIDRIDTSWFLNLAIASSVGSLVLWCCICYINIVQMRRTTI